jgi:predicted DCC family thiol-disulfide oxidoreductase YuxK
MTASRPGDRGRWSVIYDPDCGFCRWSLARLLALDRAYQLRPVALGSPEADELLADLPPLQRAASWHLVSPQHRRTSAGAAAVPLLRLLPGGRVPAGALARMPVLTERAYRWVAEHRSTLSRALPAGAKARATEKIRRHQDASAGWSRTAR